MHEVALVLDQFSPEGLVRYGQLLLGRLPAKRHRRLFLKIRGRLSESKKKPGSGRLIFPLF